MKNYTNTLAVPQAPMLGNRCGHDRKAPRSYIRPSTHKRTWHVIEESLRRLPGILSDRFHEIMFHVERKRRKRSERREAELGILIPLLISTANLTTMQVGYFVSGTFVNYQYKDIVKMSGMSMSRVKNNMYNLKRSGIVMVRQIVDEAKRHVKTIIEISRRPFELLGLSEQLDIDRAKARKNREKIEKQLAMKRSPIATSQRGGFIGKALEGLKNGFKGGFSTTICKKPNYNSQKTVAQDKRVVSLTRDILQSGDAANARDAMIKACAKLGLDPPR